MKKSKNYYSHFMSIYLMNKTKKSFFMEKLVFRPIIEFNYVTLLPLKINSTIW